MDFDYEYRDYQSKIDSDGKTVYFKPESPNALYTKEGLPKSAILTATPKKAPVKVAPSKVAPSNNTTVNYYTKRVQAKEQAYKDSVAWDKKACKGMANNSTSDKTITAKFELETAKKQLQHEISCPNANVPM